MFECSSRKAEDSSLLRALGSAASDAGKTTGLGVFAHDLLAASGSGTAPASSREAGCPESPAPLRQLLAAAPALAAARPGDYPRAVRDLALRLAAGNVASLGARGLPWGLCDLVDRLLLLRREGDDPLGSARDR